MKRLIAAACVVCCQLPAFCAEQWIEYLEQGKKLTKQQHYPEAEKLLELALQNAQGQNPESPRMLDLYDSLGMCYAYTGEQKKAEELFKKSLDIRERAPKRNDLMIYQSVVSLAAMYQKQDRFKEAEALHRRAISMFSGKGPIKSLLQSCSYFALGMLYLESERPQQALAEFEVALKHRSDSFLKGSFGPETIYEGMGRAYAQEKKYDQAEKYFRLALAQMEKQKTFNRAYALLQANYAIGVLTPQARYAEAKKMLLQSQTALEKIEGLDAVNVATCYSSMADLEIAQDHYDEAEKLVNKAIAIHEKQLGPEHQSVANDLTTLITIYRNQGKYDQAEAAGLRAVKIFKSALGNENARVAYGLVSLGNVYADKGNNEKAEKAAVDALQIHEKNSGLNSLAAVPGMILCARVAKNTNRDKVAEGYLKAAASVQEDNPANTDPSFLARVYSDLASVYESENRLDDAVTVLKKSVALKEKMYDPKHSSLVADLSLLNKIYSKQNKTQETNEISERITAIKKEHPELQRPATVHESKPIVAATPSVSQRPVRDKWALVVGISNFADSSINLKYAAKDAIDFARFLETEGKFAKDHVKLLTDKDATKENILKALGDQFLGRMATRDDLVVIYISSHGSIAKNEAGGVNFLVAHDTAPDALLSTGVPMQWLSAIIKEQVHSNRVVVVLDVCHSGSASGQKGLERDSAFDVNRLQIGEGQAIICSSAPDQISWESKTYPNSVFTRRLIECLKKDNCQIDLNSAFDSLRDEVESEVLRDRGRLQTPLLFSKSWQGPPPVLTISPASPRKI